MRVLSADSLERSTMKSEVHIAEFHHTPDPRARTVQYRSVPLSTQSRRAHLQPLDQMLRCNRPGDPDQIEPNLVRPAVTWRATEIPMSYRLALPIPWTWSANHQMTAQVAPSSQCLIFA
jgi:hypothetical protein